MNAEPEWMTDNPDVIYPANVPGVLSDVESFIGRFCAFPNEHARVAVTLWAAHTHMAEHFHSTPRLALLSPEPGSGKTRVLEVLNLLCRAPMFCLSASPAAIFRTLAKEMVTLLADEVDTIFSPRGKDDRHEDLRALLNAGYKRGAAIPRCVGAHHEVQRFDVFCPVALAGLGDAPDTIMSRSIIIRMRRRAPNEPVESFRQREQEGPGHLLRDRLSAWASIVGPGCGDTWPQMPDGVTDRPSEVWEPLIAIADAAGGDWPTRARAACLHLISVAADRRPSLGVRLLGDLRIIFGDAASLPTATIIERLVQGQESGLDADAPWAEIHGKAIAERDIAKLLKRYGITSTKVKVDGRPLQGYRREHLWDAWVRYLPLTPVQAEPPEPPEPAPAKVPQVPEVPEVPEVPDPMGCVRTVQCSGCGYFDREATLCVRFTRPVDPNHPRECDQYREPVGVAART